MKKIIAIVMIFIIVLMFGNQAYSKYDDFVVGHRGMSGVAPDNTIEGIQAAIDYGVNGIALDPRLTKDNKLILCHDENLKNYINKNVYINESNYSDIITYEYNNKQSKGYKNVSFTTLYDALTYIKQYNDLNPGKEKCVFIKLSSLISTQKKFNLSNKSVDVRLRKTFNAIKRDIYKSKFPINRIVFWSGSVVYLDYMNSICKNAGFEWCVFVKNESQLKYYSSEVDKIKGKQYNKVNRLTNKKINLSNCNLYFYICGSQNNFYYYPNKKIITELKNNNINVVYGLIKDDLLVSGKDITKISINAKEKERKKTID